MYITGEKIMFSAVIFNNNGQLASDFSRILYCELITPDGTRVAGGKYPVTDASAQGCLLIPEECITGIYYLKSYTRFMRNGIPDDYNYIMLKIINPAKSEVLRGHDTPDTSLVLPEEPNPGHDSSPIKIRTDRENYLPRENIHLDLTGNPGNYVPGKLNLSVIPEMTCTKMSQAKKTPQIPEGELQFYPETRGISLTGKVLESKTGRPIPNALVNLSVVGDMDVMAIRTDSSGRFFFALPDYEGNRDVFLCAQNLPEMAPAIFIENDFCPKPVKLPSPVFHLTLSEKEAAYRMAQNRMITSKFITDTVSGEAILPDKPRPFYGDPGEILVMEKYIDLPTVEEYFNELPVAVKVRKSDGVKHFRFYTTRTEMTIYDPLVMVDWVAVDATDKVLAMAPGAIDRIELVNAPYIKGNITYGGIISFVSKNNDFAGIDLPTSGTFVNYKFLEDCPAQVPAGPLPSNLPDSRNTLYWNPDVKKGTLGSADFSFTAPDTPGKYIILLRGIDSAGEQVIAKGEFEVRKK
jgi:hypothetical protein